VAPDSSFTKRVTNLDMLISFGRERGWSNPLAEPPKHTNTLARRS
jgi:hypothetical protein